MKYILILFFLCFSQLQAEIKWDTINTHFTFGPFMGIAEDSTGNIFINSCASTIGIITKSSDDGITWDSLNIGYEFFDQIAYNFKNNTLYFYNYKISYSRDNCKTIVDITPNKNNLNDTAIFSPLGIWFKNDTLISVIRHENDKNNFQFIFSTDDGIKWYKCSDINFFKINNLFFGGLIVDFTGTIYFITYQDTNWISYIYKLESLNSEPIFMNDIGKYPLALDEPNFCYGDNNKLFYSNLGKLYLLDRDAQKWVLFPLSLYYNYSLRYFNGNYFVLDGANLYTSYDSLKTFIPLHDAEYGGGIPPDLYVTNKGSILLIYYKMRYNLRGSLVTDVIDRQEERIQTYNFSSFSSFSSFLNLNTNNDYYKQVEIYNLQGRLLFKSGEILNIGVHIPEINYEKVLFYRFICNGKGYTGKIMNLK